MAKRINRREFIVRSVGGLAGLSIAGTFVESAVASIGGEVETPSIDRVPLGTTGLTVSRLAMGTGTIGGGGASNQTRLGQEAFTRMFRHGYDHGVRFTDMAESYGSMPYVGNAIKGLPRDGIALLSKMWTYPDGSEQAGPVRPRIEEYLRLMGTDYVDILLMHCMTRGDWDTTRTHYMEGLARAREAGLVRAVGVSCHNLDALRTAAASPWVDVIMARINPFGSKMDGTPAEVHRVLDIARTNGKGVVGMKIFGEGSHTAEHEREESIRYAIREVKVDAMTIGFESIAQLDDAINRVSRIAGER